MESNKVISFQEVTKKYKNSKIYGIQDISFEMYEGEVLGIIGGNGSGKSTLMKLIGGLLFPSEGNFKSFFRVEECGFLIEEPAFYPELSGFDNIKYYAIQKNNLDMEYITHLFSIFDLFEYRKQKYKAYSLGMKKKLAIIFSLLNKPKMLVLDEPFSGLDAESVENVSRTLSKLNQEDNMTILISSHQLNEIQTLCNRFIFIDKGKLVGKISKKEWEIKSKVMRKYTFINLENLKKMYDILLKERNIDCNEVLIDYKNYIIRFFEKNIDKNMWPVPEYCISENITLNDYYIFLKEKSDK